MEITGLTEGVVQRTISNCGAKGCGNTCAPQLGMVLRTTPSASCVGSFHKGTPNVLTMSAIHR